MNEFESNLVNVGQVFGNNQILYKIPILQRKYVWQDEDVENLLKDIEESMLKDNQSRYFIGGMVFSRDGGERLLVIDGQQRLTTLLLLISAVREYFENKNKEELSDNYSKMIWTSFIEPNTGDFKKQFFLELHHNDDYILKKLFQSDDIDNTNLSVSQQNLKTAKEVCENYFQKQDEEFVKKFMAYLSLKVYVVRTIAADQSTAFQIFETLNDRGARLEPEDLLKNLLLKSLDDNDYDNFASIWQHFTEHLMDKTKGRYVVSIPSFLKHFIMSKGKNVTKNGIFDWFKDESNKLEQPNEILDLLKELEFSSKKYRDFYDGKTNTFIANMRKLKFTQCYVVLLGALHLSKHDFDLISEALEKLAFIYVITGSKTNKLEDPFCKIADKARKAVDNKALVFEVVSDINKLTEDKRESFKNTLTGFRCKTAGDKAKLLYMLNKMAYVLDGSHHNSSTIEHVMPETTTKFWPKLPKDKYKDLVTSLGNLTLLTGPDNSSLKNKPFNEKQQVYENISCRLTNSLAKNINTGTNNTVFDKAIAAFNYASPSKWDEDEINKRTRHMINLAEYIWFNK